MRTRAAIAALIFPVVAAVLFGLGAVPLLVFTQAPDPLSAAFPYVVVGSFVLAVPIAWVLAPRLRSRRWRQGRTATH